LTKADLRGAILIGIALNDATLIESDLRGANLRGTDLRGADMTGADLSGADLSQANLVYARLANASLDGCRVYGISVWDVYLEGARQSNLCITPEYAPEIVLDNLAMAQFIYFMLHNENIRTVIDTLTSKVVLLLGRFTPERKAVLDCLREGLRARGYVPVLFDFDGPTSKSTTETVTLLARMARFVVADLTDPASIPHELVSIVPDAHVPVQPLLLEGAKTYSMASDLWQSREMLPVYRYASAEALLAALHDQVIVPAEVKVAEIQRERASALLRSGF
jgi:hypothetical protein